MNRSPPVQVAGSAANDAFVNCMNGNNERQTIYGLTGLVSACIGGLLFVGGLVPTIGLAAVGGLVGTVVAMSTNEDCFDRS